VRAAHAVNTFPQFKLQFLVSIKYKVFNPVNIKSSVFCLFASTLGCIAQPIPTGIPEGCESLKVTTSNGILVRYASSGPPIVSHVSIAIEDSITLSYSSSGGCFTSLSQILLNNLPVGYQVLVQNFDWGTVRLFGKAGTYRVFGEANFYPQAVGFTLTLNPVGINDNTRTLQDLMIYPNPGKETLNLDSKEELETVSIINASGIEVLMPQKDGHSMEISLLQFSPGLYYLKVGLINKRIIIKKFTIL
jgi:hypothetical protein